jgi:hypothetical protein
VITGGETRGSRLDTTMANGRRNPGAEPTDPKEKLNTKYFAGAM